MISIFGLIALLVGTSASVAAWRWHLRVGAEHAERTRALTVANIARCATLEQREAAAEMREQSTCRLHASLKPQVDLEAEVQKLRDKLDMARYTTSPHQEIALAARDLVRASLLHADGVQYAPIEAWERVAQALNRAGMLAPERTAT